MVCRAALLTWNNLWGRRRAPRQGRLALAHTCGAKHDITDSPIRRLAPYEHMFYNAQVSEWGNQLPTPKTVGEPSERTDPFARTLAPRAPTPPGRRPRPPASVAQVSRPSTARRRPPGQRSRLRPPVAPRRRNCALPPTCIIQLDSNATCLRHPWRHAVFVVVFRAPTMLAWRFASDTARGGRRQRRPPETTR